MGREYTDGSMPSSFVVYVDEAGDEGFSFASGSSEWFVIAAVVTLKEEDLETVKLVDHVRHQLGRPAHKPLHFRDLRHEHRLPLIAEISRASLRVVTLLIHKPSVPEPEAFKSNNLLYFHGVNELLERLAHLFQGARPRAGDGTAEVLLANRSSMCDEDLRRSVRCPQEELAGTTPRGPQIQIHSAGRRMGLQIADAVASGFFKAVEPTGYGHTEDRYARMLRPVLYRREGTFRGDGLNFWPRSVEPLLERDPFNWAREAFGEE
jgi:uncharacterized protein DUF3800